jgi:hypothetical protein
MARSLDAMAEVGSTHRDGPDHVDRPRPSSTVPLACFIVETLERMTLFHALCRSTLLHRHATRIGGLDIVAYFELVGGRGDQRQGANLRLHEDRSEGIMNNSN